MKRSMLIYLMLCFLIVSCAEEKEEEDPVVTTPIAVPNISVYCKRIASTFCDNSTGEGAMNNNYGIITLVSASGSIAATQIAQMSCGDAGGSLGNHCNLDVRASNWVVSPTDTTAVSEINSGTYTVQVWLDRDISSATTLTNDIANYCDGAELNSDIYCGAQLTINNSDDITGAAFYDSFTCITINQAAMRPLGCQ